MISQSSSANLMQNAVGAIRVSSVKQGMEGDSPEAQREQIEKFASSRGLVVKKYFIFLESASKAQQPMQEAIDYCKNPKNRINHFIIKSIDRFTRGGSLSYDLLKSQLDDSQVKLVDIYGIINADKVNTLDHLDIEYKWSIYSPTKKSEILEAERSKDELRDIMTRLIGSEIRYTRLGYWLRQPPYGYTSQKVETAHGKRSVLVPHPTEAAHIIEIFRLRANGQHTDLEIAQRVNDIGYAGRRTRKSTNKGRVLLTPVAIWRIIRQTVYAGINTEKWTNGQPIKMTSDGLVSIEQFNRANRGSLVVSESADGQISVTERKNQAFVDKTRHSDEYPYKRYIKCPHCEKSLRGSASRGRHGKLYPVYHCREKGNHSFRIKKEDLNGIVDKFLSKLELKSENVDAVFKIMEDSLQKVETRHRRRLKEVEDSIGSLEGELQTSISKIKFLSNASTIQYLEKDIAGLEEQINEMKDRKQTLAKSMPQDLTEIKPKIKHLAQHFGQALQNKLDKASKARLFGLLFDAPPTYAQLTDGTAIANINPLFAIGNSGDSLSSNKKAVQTTRSGGPDRI